MATKTLAQKLYIRPGYTVVLLNAPKGINDLLEPLPDEAKVVANPKGAIAQGEADVIVSFVKTTTELEKSLNQIQDALDKETILWFAYPKQKGKTNSELNRDQGWKTLYDMGYKGISSIAIDDTWSGVRFRTGLPTSEKELVAKQYAGERAALLPLYAQLVNAATNLGPDVQVAARQTYVAFTRGKQFALLRPTSDRIDLALRLPSAPLDARLVGAPGIGSGSMTHRVGITSVDEIDHQVLGWLHDAYRAAGG
jgi:predicted transport protein